MLKLHFGRHGKRQGADPGDPALSEEGRKEVQILARAIVSLHLAAVCSSPLKCALQTAEIFARRLDLPLVVKPLAIHNLNLAAKQKEQRVRRALEDCGLKPAEDFWERYPDGLSGGQRQRVVIASAAAAVFTRAVPWPNQSANRLIPLS